MQNEFDCLVLGGGITGAGVARDAAIRGLRTLLVDSHDFASGTSHLTSKLIHGGLRYLEQCRFRLVAEGIRERDRLLHQIAPNLVTPLRFVIPFEGQRFPKWLLTVCGLQLYGLTHWLHSGRRASPLFKGALLDGFSALLPHPLAVSFWDAQTNDARLVLATLRTACLSGAVIWNYSNVTELSRTSSGWRVELASQSDGRAWTVHAGAIVNATGPWSPDTAAMLGVPSPELMWIKGTHLLLRRPEGFGRSAIVIRSVRDLRPLWVVPWQTRLIVGTTESTYDGDLRNVRPSAEEVDDLLSSFLHYFPGCGFGRLDILGAFAGVRPIIRQYGRSENRLSRRHEVVCDPAMRLVTITGGKLTTFRGMAEKAVDHVERIAGRAPASKQTRGRLRGESLWPCVTPEDAARIAADLHRQFGGRAMPRPALEHCALNYGLESRDIARAAAARPELGMPLYEDLPYSMAELEYLCRTEQVMHACDLLKRRTSLYFLAESGANAVLPNIVDHIAPILGWSAVRQARELAAVKEEFMEDTQAIGREEKSSLPAELAVCA